MLYWQSKMTVHTGVGSTGLDAVSSMSGALETVTISFPCIPDDDFRTLCNQLSGICSAHGNMLMKNGTDTGLMSEINALLPGIFSHPIFTVSDAETAFSANIHNLTLYLPNIHYVGSWQNNLAVIYGNDNKYLVNGFYNMSGVPSVYYVTNGTQKMAEYCPFYVAGYAGRTFLSFFNESKTLVGRLLITASADSKKNVNCELFNSPQSLMSNEWLTMFGEPDEIDTDPYAPGGGTGTGGGTGNFDGTGDNVDFPSLPTLSAVDTGFITLFNPTAGQLKSLANYMWGDLFDLNTWKKIFANPMDAILGMSIVPVAVPDGGTAEVTVGNISTGVSMNRAARQYVEVDCGTLNVNEYWGAYLDYDPFTKAEIYLPYVGTHPLATDDIMNKSVHVKYHIDILSGACCAYVKCGGSVLYSFVGQCSCSIPITGNDWSNVVNGALSIAASIGTMVATGGASAPMAAATIASTAVNSMKPSVEKSGSMGGMGGMLGVQTPYLILTRPRQALPKRQNVFTGYPSFITMKLSDCSGYTEIESVHLENLSATEQELSEIESLLKGGVIF